MCAAGEAVRQERYAQLVVAQDESLPIEDRLIRAGEQKRANHEKAVHAAAEAELAECSWQPALSAASRELARRRTGYTGLPAVLTFQGDDDVATRLGAWEDTRVARVRKAREEQQLAEQAEADATETATFAPKINPHSRALAAATHHESFIDRLHVWTARRDARRQALVEAEAQRQKHVVGATEVASCSRLPEVSKGTALLVEQMERPPRVLDAMRQREERCAPPPPRSPAAPQPTHPLGTRIPTD